VEATLVAAESQGNTPALDNTPNVSITTATKINKSRQIFGLD